MLQHRSTHQRVRGTNTLMQHESCWVCIASWHDRNAAHTSLAAGTGPKFVCMGYAKKFRSYHSLYITQCWPHCCRHVEGLDDASDQCGVCLLPQWPHMAAKVG